MGITLSGGLVSAGLDTIGSLASGFMAVRIDEELLSFARFWLGNDLA